MDIGMLWFDNDKNTSLADKIKAAAGYYQNKHGKVANLCFVHPSMLNEPPSQSLGIEVRATRSVLPNHFWLGVNDL